MEVEAPRAPTIPSRLTPATAAEWYEMATGSRLAINGDDSAPTREEWGLQLELSRLSAVGLSQRRMPRLRLWDVELHGCSLEQWHVAEAEFRRVRFFGCRMTGVRFSGASMIDVSFEECKLDWAEFRETELQRVGFQDCRLVEADFYEARLKDVVIQGGDLQQASFERAHMNSVDLRKADLTVLESLHGLQGSTITVVQAVGLATDMAKHFGLELTDDTN
jgi:uncharacterized protein YjbI with pentapeptide repeats